VRVPRPCERARSSPPLNALSLARQRCPRLGIEQPAQPSRRRLSPRRAPRSGAGGLASVSPWCLLPRRNRAKAKDDNYLRAGTEIMRELEAGGARKFGWLAQGNHAVPNCWAPHTYIFVKAGFGAPFVEGEGPKTQGGGFFRPDEWGSHMAQAGEMGVWVTTARIFAREGVNSMLGKIVRGPADPPDPQACNHGVARARPADSAGCTTPLPRPSPSFRPPLSPRLPPVHPCAR
jgi:hypothetical protein